MSDKEASSASALENGPPKKAVYVAFLTIFLDLLGFGIIIPVSSFFSESLGATAAQITLLSALYSLMQFLFTPFWGRLSDRIGRRPVILSSVLFSAAGHFIFGFADGLWIIFAARMIAGFGNANLSAAQAIMSDVYPPKDRAKGMGLIGAAFGLGFLLGPAIGAFAGQWSPRAPALVAGVLALINFLLAWSFLKETNPFVLARGKTDVASSDTHGRREILPISSLLQSFKNQNLRSILMITFINTAAFAMFEVVIALLMAERYVTGLSKGSSEYIAKAASFTAWFLVVVGITAVVVQGGLIGRLSKRFGEVTLVRVGLSLMAVSFALIPIVSMNLPYSWMLLLACVLACGTGVYNPSISAYLSRSVDPAKQGEYLGLNQSISALGRVFGPAISGVLFAAHPSWPFLLAAILSVLAFLIAWSQIATKASQ